MAFDVAPAYRQGAGVDVGQINLGTLENRRGRNADTAAARAQVEHARRGLLQPRLIAALDQLADRRTRDQHALVDLEVEAGEADAPEQIGRRLATADPKAQQTQHRVALARGHRRFEIDRRQIEWQVQGVQRQEIGLVERIVSAVAEMQPR